MLSRMLSLLMVLFLVSACAATVPKDESLLDIDGGVNEQGYESSDSGFETDMLGGNGAVPGTQQDLVVNIGDRIFFGFDKYDLTFDAKDSIEKQSMWLKKYPHINVVIEGHCDERGTREYNLALGDRRAMAVRNYLIALGVESERVQTISYGKERPSVMGSDERSWAQNRRGVLVIQ